MKTKKSTVPETAKAESPFWKPETKGDTMSGKFVTFQETRIVEKGVTKVGAAIVLDNGVLVPVSWSIVHSEFADVAPKMKPGTKLDFEYEGKGGRSKIITVSVNGKKMARKGGFEEIPADKIASFFKQ